MPREIYLYVEGDPSLRAGFHAFFGQLRQRAAEKRCDFRIVPARSREEACKRFGIATAQPEPGRLNLLLIDSDGPDTGTLSVSLCHKLKWRQTRSRSIFWMVQTMEAWFYADKPALEDYYGENFNLQALKRNPNVEAISKRDLLSGLERATRATAKGPYHKVQHAVVLLTRIHPSAVRRFSPHCDKLFETVLRQLA